MDIPILFNHDFTKPLGFIREEGSTVVAEFATDVKITSEEFFTIFGGVGFTIDKCTEEDGIIYIQKARIFEFSFAPSPAGK